jgi:hypothetical protein
LDAAPNAFKGNPTRLLRMGWAGNEKINYTNRMKHIKTQRTAYHRPPPKRLAQKRANTARQVRRGKVTATAYAICGLVLVAIILTIIFK